MEEINFQQDLNKSFEIENGSRRINIINQNDFNIINKDDEDDNQYSGLLPSSGVKKTDNEGNDSNELNIFDNTNPKYKLRLYFFRSLTRSDCDIPNLDNKKIIDNIVCYFKHENRASGNDDSFANKSELMDDDNNLLNSNTIKDSHKYILF